jgi:mutator family transposase
MTQYQLTLDSETMQRLFTGDGQLGRLVEAILNQVLNAQVSEQLQAAPYERSEQRQGYRNGYKPRQLATRVGALTLQVPQVRDGQFSTELHFTLETLSSYNPPDKPDIGPTNDDESASMPPALSGFAVGKSGDAENPTHYPTPVSSEYSSTPTANVGFVGCATGEESRSLGEEVEPHPSMSGGASSPTRHPTTKPDISADDEGFADVDQTGKGSTA